MKLAQSSCKFTHPKDVHCIISLVAPSESKGTKIYTKEFKLQADPTDNNNTNEVEVNVENLFSCIQIEGKTLIY